MTAGRAATQLDQAVGLPPGLDTQLQELLAPWGGCGRVGPLHPRKANSDSPYTFLVRDQHDAPAVVVRWACHCSPRAVEQANGQAIAAREILGERLGLAVLTPMIHGVSEGRSYDVRAYHDHLAGSRLSWAIQRIGLREPTASWLRQVAAKTVSLASQAEVEAEFVRPLTVLSQDIALSAEVRGAAERAVADIQYGTWAPRCVLVHNDFWRGNLLRGSGHPVGGPRRSDLGFVLIDWRGARIRGHGVYDLVRLGSSLKFSRRRMWRELVAHSQILGCRPDGCYRDLLAALGHIGLHRRQFAVERYRELVEVCYRFLKDCGGAP